MKYDYVVYIGRFQPFHYGHVECIKKALEISNEVIVLVGSSFSARNVRNPFTYFERVEMITGHFNTPRVHILPLRDYIYNDQPWIAEVQGRVASIVNDPMKKIGIIGHMKDATSYYLNVFPQWERIDIPNLQLLNSTDIRVALYERAELRSELMPYASCRIVKTANLESLKEEWFFLKEYRKQFEQLKYPPTFVTTDAVVLCNGHLLLVKRRAQPGKGLWALPGGFIRGDERIADATIRELEEETKIKVPIKVIAGSVTKTQVFDAPSRSLRGRTITHASLIELKNEKTLPQVKGSDDAEKAKWVPLVDFLKMEEQMYEDHYHIVCCLLGLSNYSVG